MSQVAEIFVGIHSKNGDHAVAKRILQARRHLARTMGVGNIIGGRIEQVFDTERQGFIIRAVFESSSWTGR